MKLTIREENLNDLAVGFRFAQEGYAGFLISEYELEELVQVLESIEDGKIEYFWQNLGVRRERESVTLVRYRGREEILAKLTLTQAKKLASTLRSTYPQYF